MYNDQKVVVVLPAYNAALTLEQTYREIPFPLVDEVVLVDDASRDQTVTVGAQVGHPPHHPPPAQPGLRRQPENLLRQGPRTGRRHCGDAPPRLPVHAQTHTAMVSIIGNGLYPVVFGSRILGKGALKGGMPLYKYISNRFLTFTQNLLMNQKLSEYHTGYRAFSAEVLRSLDLSRNSDDFIFDNEMIAQIFYKGYQIAEVTCPTKYFDEASSINFSRSLKYGLGVLKVSWLYMLTKLRVIKWRVLA
jgi:glycosyltransferase involved in cell wall biosynthesis